jgi:hypothetical protein
MSRRWRSGFGAAVSAALTLAGTARAAERPPRRERIVQVVWVETVELDPFAYASMVREAGDIFERLGLVLLLKRGEPDDANQPGELRVVSLDRFPPDRSVLGAVVTPWSPEGTGRAYIFRPQLRGFIGRSTPSLAAARTEGILLGRIVAHETVHALVPRLPHAAVGLMAPRLTLSWHRPLSIDADTIAALHDATIALGDACVP